MNNIQPGDYVQLIDNSGLREQVGSVFEVSNVSGHGRFIQVNPTINEGTKLFVDRFHRLETKNISEAKKGDYILCNNPRYNSMKQFNMQVFKYKGNLEYSNISIDLDGIGTCDNDQFVVLSNYIYNDCELRKCIINIRDTTLEERLKLKDLLDSLGERIYNETRAFTDINNSPSFQYSSSPSAYEWAGSSTRGNISLHEFLSKFSKKKQDSQNNKNQGTNNDTTRTN